MEFVMEIDVAKGYLNSLKKYPLLSADEEIALVRFLLDRRHQRGAAALRLLERGARAAGPVAFAGCPASRQAHDDSQQYGSANFHLGSIIVASVRKIPMLATSLAVHAKVRLVEPGSTPRSEGKAVRVIDRRGKG